MKKNLFIWQMGGLTFTAVLGTILHFLYGWTGLKIFATISAVNESTWEHMKLVFIPSFIFALFQSRFAKDYKSFWFIKLIGIVIGTIFISILFYTLGGSFGKLSAIVNIAIFFVSVAIGYFTELYLFNKIKGKKWLNFVSIGLLIVILILFIIFSFNPPKIPLFLDPVTNGYGITK
ncbi:MAG: hypothetical protein E7342_00725 [Clostridiales bacterium]|nr:hypothetical protein [Clostridiales bacterium]